MVVWSIFADCNESMWRESRLFLPDKYGSIITYVEGPQMLIYIEVVLYIHTVMNVVPLTWCSSHLFFVMPSNNWKDLAWCLWLCFLRTFPLTLKWSPAMFAEQGVCLIQALFLSLNLTLSDSFVVHLGEKHELFSCELVMFKRSLTSWGNYYLGTRVGTRG